MGVELFRDEEGFTTVGMAVAMLLSLALLFSAAHVYELNTRTAEIQEVADASALAAASVTAEFMIAVALCDAVALSFTLASAITMGAGAVALCIPGAQGVAAKLLDAGSSILSHRNSFAEKVSQGLNRLQQALPFLCALNAAAVAAANNGPSDRFVAVAIPVPLEGKPIAVGAAVACESLEEAVQSSADDLAAQAAAAEEAAERANAAKLRGFMADCGANPEYCQHQRAQRLAGLPDSQNPLYHSADTWSFSVALERARAYYRYRAAHEASAADTVEEQSNAALRRMFYRYAAEQLEEGYVREGEGSFSANFPLLFAKTAELRECSLYEQLLFPVTETGEGAVMHAYSGCPQAAGAVRNGSVAQLDAGGFQECAACKFRPSDLGDVASMTARVETGFEYHYRQVAQAARDYEEARRQLDPAQQEAKDTFSRIGDFLKETLAEAADFRIEAQPPGGTGCVAMVVNLATGVPSGHFNSTFASPQERLGLRVAVSGALLKEDAAEDGGTVITALLDDVDTSGFVGGAGQLALNCWSALLSAYGSGQQALFAGMEQALNGIPLLGSSGLGGWARGKLEDLVEVAGLQPANLAALKPALAGTADVVAGDSGTFAVKFRQLQQTALRGSTPTGTVFDGLMAGIDGTDVGTWLSGEGEITVATFTVPILEVEVPVTLALPPSVGVAARSWVESAIAALNGLVSGGRNQRVWQ